jgi:ParB-like chromosome segregation protein Spo0J
VEVVMNIKWDISKKQFKFRDLTFRLKEVPIKDIDPQFQVSVFDKRKLSLLAKAMKDGEIIPPILLERNRRTKRWSVFDGNHRYYAALSLLGETGKVVAWYIR